MKLRRVVQRVLMAAGVDVFSWGKDDRKILQQIILPAIALEDAYQRVLFVGCDFYTRPYTKLFRNREYWTIELEAKRARFGSRRHVVGAIEDLRNYFSDEYFHVILCNGLFGWGLNSREVAEQAFEACFSCLAPGGLFILGWDDISAWRPFPPSDCESLGKFERFVFGPLQSCEYLTDTRYRHTYSFYRKPAMQPSIARVDSASSVTR